MKETLESVLPIWNNCIDTPFVQEVKKGTLPLDKFKHYMIQNSIYLKHYARIYGKAMYHSIALELKRVAKTRSTWILAAGALLLSVVMALLVISFARHWNLDESGEEVRLSGREAIQSNQVMLKPYEGELTPEKIRTAFETYHEVYETYGAKMEDIPKDIYYKKIAPINAILNSVREVYVDSSTGIPIPLYEISPEEAANFYEQRTERLAGYLSQEYDSLTAKNRKGPALTIQRVGPLRFLTDYLWI